MRFVQLFCGPVWFSEGSSDGCAIVAGVDQFRSLTFSDAMHIRSGTDLIVVVVVLVGEFVAIISGTIEPICVDDGGSVFGVTFVVVVVRSGIDRCINLYGHVEFVCQRFVVGRR